MIDYTNAQRAADFGYDGQSSGATGGNIQASALAGGLGTGRAKIGDAVQTPYGTLLVTGFDEFGEPQYRYLSPREASGASGSDNSASYYAQQQENARSAASIAEQQRQFNENLWMQKARGDQQQQLAQRQYELSQGNALGSINGRPTEQAREFNQSNALDYYKWLANTAANPRNFVETFYTMRDQTPPAGSQRFSNLAPVQSYARGSSMPFPSGAPARAPAPLSAAGAPSSPGPMSQTGAQYPAGTQLSGNSGVYGSAYQGENHFNPDGTVTVSRNDPDTQAPDFFTKHPSYHYAHGGIVPEPVVGRGLMTGQQYTFGEKGPEGVVPAQYLPKFLQSRAGRTVMPGAPKHSYDSGGNIGFDPGNTEPPKIPPGLSDFQEWPGKFFGEGVFPTGAMRPQDSPNFPEEMQGPAGGPFVFPSLGGIDAQGHEYHFSTYPPEIRRALEHWVRQRATGHSYSVGGVIGSDQQVAPYDPYAATAGLGDPAASYAPPPTPTDPSNPYSGSYDPYANTTDLGYIGPPDPTGTPSPAAPTGSGGTAPTAPSLPSTSTGAPQAPASPSLNLSGNAPPPGYHWVGNFLIADQTGTQPGGGGTTTPTTPIIQQNVEPPPVYPTSPVGIIPGQTDTPTSPMMPNATPSGQQGNFWGGGAVSQYLPEFLPGEDMGVLGDLQSQGAVPPFLQRIFAQQRGVQSQGTNQPQPLSLPKAVPLVSRLAYQQMLPTERQAFESYLSSYGIDPQDYWGYVDSVSPQGGASSQPLFGNRIPYLGQ